MKNLYKLASSQNFAGFLFQNRENLDNHESVETSPTEQKFYKVFSLIRKMDFQAEKTDKVDINLSHEFKTKDKNIKLGTDVIPVNLGEEKSSREYIINLEVDDKAKWNNPLTWIDGNQISVHLNAETNSIILYNGEKPLNTSEEDINAVLDKILEHIKNIKAETSRNLQELREDIEGKSH